MIRRLLSSFIGRIGARATAALCCLAASAAAIAQPVASGALKAPVATVGANVPQMFLNASAMVQAVMIGLVLTSVLSWATLAVKLIELRQGGRTLKRAEERLQLAPSLGAVGGVDDKAVWAMLSAARRESERSADLQRGGLHEGVKERTADALQRVEEAQSRQMGRGLNILASVGSVSPFVGLFGTVWGIMHSFIDIAHANTTSLAVVAPGIAEALLATAFGLGAAIPATLMYNALGRRVTDYRAKLADAVVEVLGLVSRDADRMRMVAASAAPPPDTAAGAADGAAVGAAGREGSRVVAFHAG